MSFESKLTVLGYAKGTTGEDWPDYVILDNGGIVSVEYEMRKYYPVDRDALLELADEIEDRAGLVGYARRIREACGVVEP